MAKKILVDPIDFLHRPITIGCYVTYTINGILHVGEVTKFGAKKISITRIPTAKWKNMPDVKYAEELTIVPDDAVTFWVMKNPK